MRERHEREIEAEELGAVWELGAGEELPLFLPTPSFMASADKKYGMGHFSFVISSVISLVFYPRGKGLGGGQRGACNLPPPRALRTGQMDKIYTAIVKIA